MDKIIYAGKTKIPVGTKIRIVKGEWKDATGEITHAFGFLGMYDYSAIAGAFLDDPEKYSCQREIHLFKGDFEVIV